MPTFKATSDGSSQYAELEPGTYDAVVTKAEYARSQGGNDMIRLYLTVYGVHGPVEVQENLVFTQKAFWKVEQFWRATGHDFKHGDELSIEPEDCYDLTLCVITEQRPGEKNPQVKFPFVVRFIKPDEAKVKGPNPVKRPAAAPQQAAARGGYNIPQQGAGQASGGFVRNGNSFAPAPAGRAFTGEMEDDDIPF